MHGPDSGNLMIYYNNKILQIDFKVFESKSYKFFIDEELCEIKVIQNKNGSFGYEFQFDYKTETTGNQKRKKREKKWAIQSMIAIISFFGLIIIGSFIFLYFRTDFLEHQLKKNGEYALVTMRQLDRMGKDKLETFYHYTTHDGEKYASKISIVAKPPQTPHGLPIKNGDQFAIKYARNNIFNHKIDYNQPSEQTAIKIMQRVAELHIQHHQGRIQQELFCEVQAAYEVAGLDGLATIYRQLEDASTSSKYNKDSFLKLIRDTPFQKAVDDCWRAQNE